MPEDRITSKAHFEVEQKPMAISNATVTDCHETELQKFNSWPENESNFKKLEKAKNMKRSQLSGCRVEEENAQPDYRRFSIISFSSVASTTYYSADGWDDDDGAHSDSTLGYFSPSEEEYCLTEERLHPDADLHIHSERNGSFLAKQLISKHRYEGVSCDGSDDLFLPRPATPTPPVEEYDDCAPTFCITAFNNFLSSSDNLADVTESGGETPVPGSSSDDDDSQVDSAFNSQVLGDLSFTDARACTQISAGEGDASEALGEVKLEANNSSLSAAMTKEVAAIGSVTLSWTQNDHKETTLSGEDSNERLELVAPSFEEIMEDASVTVGSDVMFTIIIFGNPPPDVIWLKDDEELSAQKTSRSFDGERHSLIIKDVTPEQGGVYSCVGKNDLGQVVCKAELTVQTSADWSSSSEDEHSAEHCKRRFSDDYVTCDVIGCGSFAMVKRVRSKTSGKLLAGKIVRRKGDAKKQLGQEANILRRLDHQGVVSFVDYYGSEKHKIIVMEQCDQELFDFFLSLDELTEKTVAKYIRQLCLALSYIHQQDVVHLDLKPENLMLLKSRDTVKLIDFGSAKEINQEHPVYWDRGIPEFVAPEIVTSEPVTCLTDMWSVGVMTYLALSGVSPFVGETDQATLFNIRDSDWSFAHKEFAKVSEPAKLFITKLLASAPSERLTAEQVVDDAWMKKDLASNRPLSTERLKYFQSRRTWQRSLVTDQSSLVARSISSLLRGDFDSTSLNVPRNAIRSVTSSTSSSDSEDDNGFLGKKERSNDKRSFKPTGQQADGDRLTTALVSAAIRKRELFEKSRSYSGSMDRPLQMTKAVEEDVISDLPAPGSTEKPGWKKCKLSTLGKKVSFEDEFHSTPITTGSGGLSDKRSELLPLEGDAQPRPCNLNLNLSQEFRSNSKTRNDVKEETKEQEKFRSSDAPSTIVKSRAVAAKDDTSPTATCCVHRDIWGRSASRSLLVHDSLPYSTPVAKKPTKGILKKSGSIESQSPTKLQPVDDNQQEIGGCRTKPFRKSPSLDIALAPRKGGSPSGIKKLSSAAKRRLQFRRGQSAESALQPMKSLCGGLRGPLMERSIDEVPEDATVGARMRSSPGIKKVSSVDKIHLFRASSPRATGTSQKLCQYPKQLFPCAPSHPEVSRVRNDEAWVTWKPPANGVSDNLRYVVEYQDSERMTWTLYDDVICNTTYHVTGLDRSCTYVFRVAARNDTGQGPFSDVTSRLTFS